MVGRQSWLLAARSCATFEGVVAVLCRPDLSSLAVEVLPFLKHPNHSKVRLWLMHESPKACFNISKVSLPVLTNFTQNLMHTFVRQIPPNRRYQKIADGWCNTHIKTRATIKRFHIQPTPLGTLTHKTPPQHTLAGNSWTTSDLRVMSFVLGLLDKPSYAPGLNIVSVNSVYPW